MKVLWIERTFVAFSLFKMPDLWFRCSKTSSSSNNVTNLHMHLVGVVTPSRRKKCFRNRWFLKNPSFSWEVAALWFIQYIHTCLYTHIQRKSTHNMIAHFAVHLQRGCMKCNYKQKTPQMKIAPELQMSYSGMINVAWSVIRCVCMSAESLQSAVECIKSSSFL